MPAQRQPRRVGEHAEPGLYREIRPAWADENLRYLCRHLQSHLFFAHVRAATGTAITRVNCHPFACGKWLFMHNGFVGNWSRLRRKVEGLIPDQLYPQRNGTTDTEAIFLAIMGAGIEQPLAATVVGNYRLTGESTASDIHHVMLDFGTTPFPVVEGQSIGILPPGTSKDGKTHHARQYSIASPRDGEREGYNNLSLTVKRVTQDHRGNVADGVCSNYLCDLKKGDKVRIGHTTVTVVAVTDGGR